MSARKTEPDKIKPHGPEDSPCADCGVVTVVMFVMEPGVDGKRWRLCARCWRKFGAGTTSQLIGA